MLVSTAQRVLVIFTFLSFLLVAVPALADDVTVSGNVTFSSLDGSSQDHDGSVNGTFTVDDGDLTVLGTINCNDSGPGNASACSMTFAVSGDMVIESGAAIYAENRTGGGSGGNITFAVGGELTLAGATVSQAGAIVSAGNENNSSGNAGHISVTAGGSVHLGSGSVVTAASKGGSAGEISITGEGSIAVHGTVASGPSSTIAASKYTGAIFSGGSASAKGGNITIRSNTHSQPAVTVSASATIASQGGNAGAGSVIVEGCGILVNGLIASISSSGSGSRVTLRSGTSISVDGSTLGGSGTGNGMIRADALQQGAGAYSANLFAREGVAVSGPSTGALHAVNSNGGKTSKDPSGTINVISTGAGVSATGNAFAASGSDAGDQGGKINIAAMAAISLDGARINASGDHATSNNDRAGGSITVRSHSGAVSWQNGSGDVRPTGSGSGIPVAKRGTITISYCTSAATAGSSFPTNGAAIGPFPTVTQACSPASPSLPPGEQHPDCNDPPVAANDAYTVAEGGTINVAAPGVLGNDVDPDGDPITAVLVSGPSWATSFTLNADGSFSYTHDGSEHHSDSFTYQATDGTTTSNVATVTITVTPVNDAPVANNDSYTVAEGGTINYSAPGVLVNDSDPDGPSMAAVLVSGPAHASSFVLNADGSFVYVHDGSETTSDGFTYKANDGSLDSNVAAASITITPVNDTPVANGDAFSVAEGGTLSGSSVLANDTDAEGSGLTAVLVSGPANASSFVLNANGTFNYVHNGGETTGDSFTYKASDGSLDSNVATVTITISPVNDAPVANGDGPYTVNEGGTLNGTSVLANDTDAESNTLTALLVSGPAHASSFVLNANGTFTYVHDGSETTSDSFTYKANDGSLDSNVATVTITITAANDAPVANGDAYSVNEGGTLNGTSVLANDTDAENDSLTAVLVSGPANATSFTLNANGMFTYVHNGSETTSDSFTYKANDGSLDSNVATVTITINAVNDAPVANGDGPYNVNEGGTLNGSSVLTNDTDAENDSLTAVLVSGPANASSFTLNANGTFTYVHNGSETTSDSFTYKANDGTSDSNVATVTITITPVNDAPVANNDAYSVAEGGTLSGSSVLANDTDAEGGSLTAVLVSGPVNAASFVLNADGTFMYVHNGSETTTDSFTYKASDGSLDSNVATVTITITPVNDAPVANNDGPYSVSTGGTLTVAAPGVLGNDTDVDGPAISAILVSGPANATSFTFNPDGSFSYSSVVVGVDVFTYKANDGSLDSNIATVTINVISAPPVAADDAFTTVGNTELRAGTGASATPHVAVAGSVLANDSDPDTPSGLLVVTAYDSTSANGGAITMNPAGNFSYLPPVGFTGTDSFNYTVSDGPNSDTGTVSITFTGRVWYVRNNASSGDGRSHAPFNTLGAAQSASAPGDTVFVHRGDGTISGHSSGIALQGTQRLIGEGVALVVGPHTLHPAGLRPTLGGVVLASGNTVSGLNVNATSNGISGTSVSNGTITQVGVTGGTVGITLTSAGGTFTLSDVVLSPGSLGLWINAGTANVSATNLSVTTSGASGIFGTGTGTITFAGTSTVSTTNGAAIDLSNHTLAGGLTSVNASGGVDGIRLLNTFGTFAVNGTGTAGSGGTIANMFDRGVDAVNAAGVSLRWMNINNSGQQGVLLANSLGGSSSLDVQSTSLSNNFAAGVQVANSGSGSVAVTVNGSTFASNGGSVVVQTTAAGALDVAVTNNGSTFNTGNAFVVNRSSASSANVDVTFTGNTIGAAGVAGSGATCGGGCSGLAIFALGGGTMNALIDSNVIRQVDLIGIRARSGQGSGAMNLTVTNNTISQPVAGATNGINVQSGTLTADTNATCATLTGNNVSGGFSVEIAVRNTSAGSTFSLPGYAGLGTDTTAVANFIKANNTITTASATRKTTAPANQFSGGAPCPTPAP